MFLSAYQHLKRSARAPGPCACMKCARCEVCAHMCVVQESVAICVQSGAVTVAAEISLSLDR